MRVLSLIASQSREEFACTGLGDGTQMLDGFVTGQTDTVIGNGQRARFLVEGETDLQIRVIGEKPRVVQRLEAQLVAGIRSVRNQFAQEDFLVAVQRVDHQVKQLFDFSLKAQCFLGSGH